MDMAARLLIICMDVPILHIVSYFAGTAVIMSLHKLTIALTPIMILATVFIQIKAHKFQMLARLKLITSMEVSQEERHF